MMTPSIFGENLFDDFLTISLISLHMMTRRCRNQCKMHRENCTDAMRQT